MWNEIALSKRIASETFSARTNRNMFYDLAVSV